MKYQQNRTWIEVSLDNLMHNFRILSDLAGPACPVLAVVKGNASGLGAQRIARELEAQGCAFFGVATVEEAVELRECGVMGPILVFGAAGPDHAPAVARHRIALAVFDHAHAAAISDSALRRNARIDVHMKVDTGLARFGIPLATQMDNALRQALDIAALPGVALRGVFTHAASAGAADDDAFTLNQFALFQRFTEELARSGLRLIRHFANSPALLRFPQTHLDMVRAGTALFGFNRFRPEVDLKEVASLKTRIVHVRELRAGDTLGYGRLYTARRRTRIGIVPIGYGDGLPRCVGNRAHFLAHGKKAPLVGKLCMDMSFIDITDIPEAAADDIVTVFGQDGPAFQSVFAIADLFPGSGPEVTTVLGRRIPRFYLRGGDVAGRAAGYGL